MRTFKEQLQKDFDNIFFNLDEFAEIHTVEGQEVSVVIDTDNLLELDLGKKEHSDGVYTDEKMLFIQKKDLDFEPVAGQHLNFDGEVYPILNVFEAMGGYTIILRSNED